MEKICSKKQLQVLAGKKLAINSLLIIIVSTSKTNFNSNKRLRNLTVSFKKTKLV
jgi:hypothetical protein